MPAHRRLFPPPPPLSEAAAAAAAAATERTAFLASLGFSLAVLGAFSGSVGLMFIKSSNIHERSQPLWRRWRWMVGFFFQAVVSAVTDSFAFVLCPLSLISPLAGLTIAATTLLTGVGFLGIYESVSRNEIGCLFWIVLGVTLASISGPRVSSNSDMQELGLYFSNPVFVVFGGFIEMGAFAWGAVISLPCFAGIRPPEDSLTTTLLSALTAACTAALTQLFLKIVALCVSQVISEHSWRLVAESVVWFAGLGLATNACLQLYLLNATLRSAKVTLSVPIFSSLLIVLTIAVSAIFFDDFQTLPRSSCLLFSLGAVFVTVGIGLLSYLQSTRPSQKTKNEKQTEKEVGESLLTVACEPTPPVSEELAKAEA